MCATALVGQVRADTPVVRIAASRGVVSAPIWNIANHAAQHGFSVQMSVLFTYADQQRACQNGETASATTGINNPAILADQGIAMSNSSPVSSSAVKTSSYERVPPRALGKTSRAKRSVSFPVLTRAFSFLWQRKREARISAKSTLSMFRSVPRHLQHSEKGDLDGFVLFAPMTDQAVVEGIGYYPSSLDIGACSLGPANGASWQTRIFWPIRSWPSVS
jgi:hypothetical protein